MTNMLIDTHCHLTDERLSDTEAVLRQAREAGVEKVIMPSTSVADAKKAVEIAEKFEQYCLVGIHPEEIEKVTEEAITELRDLIQSSRRVVGVGEIGLDFYYDKEKKTAEKQREFFRKQMDLALENNLPVAIHMREAEEEMTEELLRRESLPSGQFHCFAGSQEFLRLILEKGFYISFAGNVTYKSAESLRSLLKMVPLERLLLETDSPYLSPEPRRGTVNTPANVKITAELIASILEKELNLLTEITTKNAKCLYSLES